MKIQAKIEQSSLAALAGLLPHFVLSYAVGYTVLSDVLAELIMGRTPSAWAVPVLNVLGDWAKPFAATGGLAILGFVLFLAALPGNPLLSAVLVLGLGAGLAWWIDYASWMGWLSFFLPALAVLLFQARKSAMTALPRIQERRSFLSSALLSSGTVFVALEAYARNQALAARAVSPVPLFPLIPPSAERLAWGQGLVRKPLTPIKEFYVMSKNTVDPAPDPKTWRLRVLIDGRPLREFTYSQLLGLPRQERYSTMRCVSNTLKSDLMGTAYWSGIQLGQLLRREEIPTGIREMAVIGLDGHGDSFSLDYAFSNEPLFALGMNGNTLDRNHGFPIRLLCPRYYGFKSIKWIDQIHFQTQPYFGTWPKLGYTKEPLVHTGSFIDRIERQAGRIRAGGVAFSGVRGIQRVQVRAGEGSWVDAQMESPLSPFCLTRWQAEVPLSANEEVLYARALDGEGKWQSEVEKPLFPDGVSGPTSKRIPTQVLTK